MDVVGITLQVVWCIGLVYVKVYAQHDISELKQTAKSDGLTLKKAKTDHCRHIKKGPNGPINKFYAYVFRDPFKKAWLSFWAGHVGKTSNDGQPGRAGRKVGRFPGPDENPGSNFKFVFNIDLGTQQDC